MLKLEGFTWHQDGRTMILQLLQQGIFSQPPHLFSNALDFVFEALDPKLVNIQKVQHTEH